MDAHSEPAQPDLTLHLPRDVYYQLIHTLRGTLAPITGSPEDVARRDNAAIAQVACLLPANADEANLAAQYVAANARALECLRIAQQYTASDHSFSLSCTAQATRMMREARSARSLLLRVQAVREKREADTAATDRAAWTEHCAIGLMAQALGLDHPAATAEPPPEPPVPEPPQSEEPQVDPAAAAEEYAMLYPQRAALIRRLGRVPDNVSFGPPEEPLVRALVTGRTPALLALDQQVAEPLPA